jgi:hypothetical protein
MDLTIDSEALRHLAKQGAAIEHQKLTARLEWLESEFPDVFAPRRGTRHTAKVNDTGRRRQRVFTSAERRAISVRMKKYWADRRKKIA